MGPLEWDHQMMGQDHDDYMYTWLNHDQMYTDIQIIGDEILYFLREWQFSQAAFRNPLEGDHFAPPPNEADAP